MSGRSTGRFPLTTKFLACAGNAVRMDRLLNALASSEAVVAGTGSIGSETGGMRQKGSAVTEIIPDMVGGKPEVRVLEKEQAGIKVLADPVSASDRVVRRRWAVQGKRRESKSPQRSEAGRGGHRIL